MEEKVSGIVLNGVNFGDNDKILSIFTLEQGVISAKIKGVKKAKAKLKFASEPFCFAEFITVKKGKMRTVTNASLIDSFYPLREDIVKFYAGGVVLEYCKKFLQEGILSVETFYLAINALKEISYGDNPKLALCFFLIKALSLSGFSLSLDGCFKCQNDLNGRVFFDYSYGGFFCEECQTPTSKEINCQTYLSLRSISLGDAVEEQDCVKPLRLLDCYVTQKIEENLKSLKELNKLFENA